MKTPKYLVQAIYEPRSGKGHSSITVKTVDCQQRLNELLKEFTNIDEHSRLVITVHKLSKHDIENNFWTVTE